MDNSRRKDDADDHDKTQTDAAMDDTACGDSYAFGEELQAYEACRGGAALGEQQLHCRR